MKSSPYNSSALLLLLRCLVAVSEAVIFTCNTMTTATCRSIIGYMSRNATTYGNVSSLFQVPLASILGTNNLHYTTSSSTGTVPGNTTIKILVPCQCTNGVGQSDHIPVYTIDIGQVESGNTVEVKKVVHLAYQVESGNTVASIAAMYGTADSTLLEVNEISDSKSLEPEKS
ncbi:LysM domain-containing GPI-anchored protein 2 [Rhynchospora pubera]|uniref:LysM domain-containing GPI-anchored protein 2 n=1 Tax=Rhynchospora pubera TaxID=906938 RepID=A0AAV8E352_9POAL|nr:LysM domain-containing GPI-anchored protein 2 [Rhynchospora pubera]